jgi:hypothetical protein
MSKKALVPVNVLAKASAPTGQYAGDVYFNTLESALYTYTGSVWTTVSGGNVDGGTATSNYVGITTLNGGSA